MRPSEGPLSAQLNGEKYHKAAAHLLIGNRNEILFSLEQDLSGQWRLGILYDYAASPGVDAEPHHGEAGGCAVPKVQQQQLKLPLDLSHRKQQLWCFPPWSDILHRDAIGDCRGNWGWANSGQDMKMSANESPAATAGLFGSALI